MRLLTETTMIAPNNGLGSTSNRGVKNRRVTKIRSPAKMLFNDVFAPACSAIAEREKLEETGRDWKSPPRILLLPMAINS